MPSEMAEGEQAAWKQRLPSGRGFEGSCDPCKVGVWVEGPPSAHEPCQYVETLRKQGESKGLRTRSSLTCLTHAQRGSSSHGKDSGPYGKWATSGMR